MFSKTYNEEILTSGNENNKKEDANEINVQEKVDNNQLNEKEKFYIKKLNSFIKNG